MMWGKWTGKSSPMEQSTPRKQHKNYSSQLFVSAHARKEFFVIAQAKASVMLPSETTISLISSCIKSFSFEQALTFLVNKQFFKAILCGCSASRQHNYSIELRGESDKYFLEQVRLIELIDAIQYTSTLKNIDLMD